MVPSYVRYRLPAAQRIFVCLRRGRISDQAQHHYHLQSIELMLNGVNLSFVSVRRELARAGRTGIRFSL